MTLSERRKGWLRALRRDPGDPVFAEYAERLRQEGKFGRVLEVCFRGLSRNPGCDRGRLVLARAFFERGFVPFAVRELREIQSHLPENRSVRKLLQELSPESELRAEGSSSPDGGSEEVNGGSDATVAEAEFDFDLLDELDDSS